MTHKQRISILVGAAVLIAMWLFPPWTIGDYYFLFDTPLHHGHYGRQQIDFGRLITQSVAALIISATAFFAFRQSPPK